MFAHLRKNRSFWIFAFTFLFVLSPLFHQSSYGARAKSATKKKSAPLDQLGEDYILFHTPGGDLVFGLYPNAAPRHVEQLLKLVKSGAYDGSHFFRVERGFLAQISSVGDRLTPLSDEQQALIKKIPAEFSSLHHAYGVLTMARDESDPDSAESSFSIMLGEAPHLDGKYTIFGRVVDGAGVLDEFVKVPVSAAHSPTTRLTVHHAEVIRTPFPALIPVHPIITSQMGEVPGSPKSLIWGVFGLALAQVLVSGLAFVFRGRLSGGQLASLHAISYLMATFLATLAGLYLRLELKWFGFILLFMMVFAFWIVSRFESFKKSS